MKTNKGSRKAFERTWKRHKPSRDTWGVEYVYDTGAWKIWQAALRWSAQSPKSNAPGGRK